MNIYRITKEEYSHQLKPSGYAARWNPKGSQVIYAAESRSLACLENLVHRSGEGSNKIYNVMIIKVPDNLTIEIIDEGNLTADWRSIENFAYCQKLGADWISKGKSAILKVPSVLIKNEHNFVLNCLHPDYIKIKLTGTEDFIYDPRL